MRSGGWADVCVGPVVNPCAGGGEDTIAVVRTLLERLGGTRLVVVDGTIESRVASQLGIGGRALRTPAGSGSAVATSTLLDAGAEVLVGVGGDGTLCDIASAILETGGEVKLIGVGIGSANVGPLISLLGRDAGSLEWSRMREEVVHGIDAGLGGERLGTAFNDVVFANSFFGTRGGVRVDLDARAKLAGEDRAIEPASVCTPETWIAKNGRRLVTNEEGIVQQIVASPVNVPSAYVGKAVSGMMCWAPYVGDYGVVAATSAVMVRTKLDRGDVRRVEPLRLLHVSLGPEDRVDVGGLQHEAVVVVDGNPIRALTPTDTVALSLRERAIRVLRPADAERTEIE